MPTRYFRSRRICLMVGRKEVSTTMQQFDAIVVGAGPAGSSAALAMARAGLQVALIERGEYPGAKNVSGAALYARSEEHTSELHSHLNPVSRLLLQKKKSTLQH